MIGTLVYLARQAAGAAAAPWRPLHDATDQFWDEAARLVQIVHHLKRAVEVLEDIRNLLSTTTTREQFLGPAEYPERFTASHGSAVRLPGGPADRTAPASSPPAAAGAVHPFDAPGPDGVICGHGCDPWSISSDCTRHSGHLLTRDDYMDAARACEKLAEGWPQFGAYWNGLATRLQGAALKAPIAASQ